MIFFKDITTKQKPFYLKEVKSIKFIKQYWIRYSQFWHQKQINFCINNNENTWFDLEKQLKPVGISYSKYIVFMKNLELGPEGYREKLCFIASRREINVYPIKLSQIMCF